jgi:hypothetical protein
MWRNVGHCLSVLISLTVLGVAPELRAAEPVVDGSFAGMSSDGRFIAFTSENPDLVEGDTNGVRDLFLLDRTSGDVERVSLDGTAQSTRPAFIRPVFISTDGSELVFNAGEGAPFNANCCIRIHNRRRGVTEALVVSSRSAFVTSISDDAGLIAFETDAPLIPGDLGGGGDFDTDVYLWDRTTSTVENVSVLPGEEFERSSGKGVLTRDGRFVAYTGTPGGLALLIRDRSTGITDEIDPGGPSSRQSIEASSLSDDGRFVAFVLPGDHLFTELDELRIWDRAAGASEPLAVDVDGNPTLTTFADDAALSLSGDGRYALFSSTAPRLVPEDDDLFIDLFLLDRELGVTKRIAQGTTGGPTQAGFFGRLSQDGGILAYSYRDALFILDRNPAVPTSLVLEPASAEVPVENEHCVTAQVDDAAGTPLADVSVAFALSGEPAEEISTDAAGQAEFCFTTPALPGELTVSAVAQGGDEPSDEAAVTVVAPPSTAGCRAKAAGTFVAANGRTVAFEAHARVRENLAKGDAHARELVRGGLVLDSSRVDALTCSAGAASLFGIARVSGVDGVIYRIDLRDTGRGRPRDQVRIRLSTGYDSGDQSLRRGQIDIDLR